MNRPSCLPASAPLALVALSLAASITGCGGDGPSDPCAGLLPGDLVISEVMANPSGADDGREWVEIHNPGSAELSLTGLELVRSAEDGSGARAHVLDTADLLAAGAYYVLGGVLDAARPSYVNYGYGDALGDFGNTSGRVVLRCGDRVIDEVVYLDSTDGASRAYDGDLPPNATANDDTTRWCDSPATFSTGDFGSPGVRNASCGGSSLGRCSEGGVERDTIPPTEGDLVITELHPNPMAVADGEGEWFEVLVQAEVDLNGLQLGKVPGTVLTTLSSSECLSVSPGTYVLFAAGTDSATNGGLTNVDFLADLALSNSGGSVFVGYADVVLDTFTYTSSGDGASTQLDPRHLTFDENDDEALWCRSAATYGDGDRGTPGGANMQCMFPLPEGMCDAGGGTLRQIVPPVLGDVVITELMPDSGAVGDTAGEWFEVYFASDADLNGLEMGTTLGSVGYRIEQEACLRVTAGSYVVFAKDAAGANGGLPGTPIDYDTLTLGNSATSAEPGTLFVGLDGTALDVANWFTSDAGVARSLDVDALDADENQTEANWCAAAATDTYGAGDRGTPGAGQPGLPLRAAAGPVPGQRHAAHHRPARAGRAGHHRGAARLVGRGRHLRRVVRGVRERARGPERAAGGHHLRVAQLHAHSGRLCDARRRRLRAVRPQRRHRRERRPPADRHRVGRHAQQRPGLALHRRGRRAAGLGGVEQLAHRRLAAAGSGRLRPHHQRRVPRCGVRRQQRVWRGRPRHAGDGERDVPLRAAARAVPRRRDAARHRAARRWATWSSRRSCPTPGRWTTWTGSGSRCTSRAPPT
jgi:hypothetical protein